MREGEELVERQEDGRAGQSPGTAELQKNRRHIGDEAKANRRSVPVDRSSKLRLDHDRLPF